MLIGWIRVRSSWWLRCRGSVTVDTVLSFVGVGFGLGNTLVIDYSLLMGCDTMYLLLLLGFCFV